LEKWQDYYKDYSEIFENDCHTLSRANCYLNEDKNQKLLEKRQKLETEHLFYNAVSCAKNVFGFKDDRDVSKLVFLE
jgi:hypothetical protein